MNTSLQSRLCTARTRPQARRAAGVPRLASVVVGAGVWIVSALWLLGVI